MAVSDVVQTSTAAFSFGIILQASLGVLILYLRGHGASLLQDHRRLVLVLSLILAAMWAQIDFINLLIPTKSSPACQALLVFSTASDQLARVGFEQFLFSSIRNDTNGAAGSLIVNAILAVRIVGGGLLVGFTRTQFAPVCVARTSLLPVSIVVVALDFVIIISLIIRASSSGMLGELRGARLSANGEQDRAVVFSMAAFFVWTGTSVVMLLGIPSTLLLLRTTLPAAGLLVLIGVVAVFSGALMLQNEGRLMTPEATSPFVTPPPSRELFRDNNGNGSPIVSRGELKGRSLFVVNPSVTPRDSPTTMSQNNRADGKGFAKAGMEVSVHAIEADEQQDKTRGKHSNSPGYRGSSGVFPTTFAAPSIGGPHVQSNVGESMRSVAAFPPSVSKPKRSLFNRSKPAPQSAVRSLGISKPIMATGDGSLSQPFPKMQTIDLATAAANERERREGATARSRLLASRPAPKPPAVAPIEGLRKSISVKRKEMPGRPNGLIPSIPSQGVSGSSLGVVAGSTTSASLSPGTEEIRRRSPRNESKFEKLLPESNSSQISLPQRQTIGLPSNPRAQMITMEKAQTVMFMNNITYNDPGVVKTIISGAPKRYESTKNLDRSSATSVTATLKSSNSIIHRPRPYKRNTEKDRALFPSEPSPHHRRSKSASSIANRKSILMSHPGSPTQLPPLPAPPTSAARLARILPNDTRSMTFDEKIELLFPAPPGSTLLNYRRSSVPSLPRVPSVYISDTPTARTPTEEQQQSRRASKRTTLASFTFEEFQLPASVPNGNDESTVERQTHRLSTNIFKSPVGEAGQTSIPGTLRNEFEDRNVAYGGVKEVSIRDSGNPHDMRSLAFTDTTSTDISSGDDSTFWASIHSKAPVVDLATGMTMAASTFVQRRGSRQPVVPPVPPIDCDEREEIMTVMLDPRESELLTQRSNRQSFLLDANQSLSGENTPTSSRGQLQWHRRIGDILPTFSERESKKRSRKVPPPAPLLLNSRGRNATVIVRASEPSPVDSPDRAIKEIQAQLKRFEEPERNSLGSILRKLPDETMIGGLENRLDDRFMLLENLEKEMGNQENQWQVMHQNHFSRESVSSTASPPPRNPSRSVSPVSLARSTDRPPPNVSRRARIRSSMTIRSKEQESVSTASTQSSDNSRASVWQQRLAEAQMEYIENAPALLRKRSVNFLSLSKARIGSPTPPESIDSGTDSEADSNPRLKSERQNPEYSHAHTVPSLSLWRPAMVSPKAAIGRMWNPPYDKLAKDSSMTPPAQNLRPPQRTSHSTLAITSNQLWANLSSSSNTHTAIGLWGPAFTLPRMNVTRRATQRPQRKSKRATYLPDIVENPKPLPNKRDTLGIFQFPWGETSDSAVYQPAFDPSLLAGPRLNAKLDARSRMVEPEIEEYSSSFFDEYDGPEEDQESDDDFDETTLWEIASLLKSKDVPSKNSLLPPARAIIEDYDYETDFESDSDDHLPIAGSAFVTQLPIRPLETSSLREEPRLWEPNLSLALENPTGGIRQPDSQVWSVYANERFNTVRVQTRSVGDLPTISLESMWAPPHPSLVARNSSMWQASLTEIDRTADLTAGVVQSVGLWVPLPQPIDAEVSGLFKVSTKRSLPRGTDAAPAAIDIVRALRPSSKSSSIIMSRDLWSPMSNSNISIDWLSKTSKPVLKPLLWVPNITAQSSSVTGLFVLPQKIVSNRTSDSIPAAITMKRVSYKNRGPLRQLTSNALWAECEVLQPEHHWISESSTRPESPSIYSEISSGSSSPASDSSSINSSSTKASSLWGFGGSMQASQNWDPRFSKEAALSSSYSMKMPTRSEQLGPLPKPRVFSSKDLWESKNPRSKDNLNGIAQNHFKKHSPELFLRKPVYHSYRSTLPFLGDWDKALAEAIAAGSQPKFLSRPVTTASDWDDALSLAISQAQIRVNRSMCGLKMWGKALSEALTEKASRKLASVILHDVSVRHPVFFGADLVINTNEVHPAAFGYFVQSEERHAITAPTSMWNGHKQQISPVTTATGALGLLWPHGSITTRALSPDSPSCIEKRAQLSPYSRGPSNNAKTARVGPRHAQTATLTFRSSNMFSRPSINKGTKNWLRDTSLSSNSRGEQPLGMWTSKIPSSSPQRNSRMWEAFPTSNLGSPPLFPNPHSEPWFRNKKYPESTATLESKKMWRRLTETRESSRIWLINKRVSKVEFRY